MYPKKNQYLGYFGQAPMSPTDTMSPGSTYAFSYDMSLLSNLSNILVSDSDVQANVIADLANYQMGNVVSMSRGLFSSTYVFVVNPTAPSTVQDWMNAFAQVFSDLGYTANFIQVVPGSVSTQPGGVQGALTQATTSVIAPLSTAVGTSAANILGPTMSQLLPWAAGLAALLIFIKFSPQKQGRAPERE
jgi:hypothetical protein